MREDQVCRVGKGRGERRRERGHLGHGNEPAGTRHNLKIAAASRSNVTRYSHPEHVDGVVQLTKSEADASHEHFDGKTTEE